MVIRQKEGAPSIDAPPDMIQWFWWITMAARSLGLPWLYGYSAMLFVTDRQ